MAVVYIWRVVEVAYFGDAPAHEKFSEAPVWMLLVLWVSALANVVFGVNPSLPMTLSSEAASALLQHLP